MDPFRDIHKERPNELIIIDNKFDPSRPVTTSFWHQQCESLRRNLADDVGQQVRMF